MPLIAVIVFIAFLTLLFFLTSILAQRKKLKAAENYGIKHFDINLPDSVKIPKNSTLPPLNKCSDSEAFFMLIIPYIGSLMREKRLALQTEMEHLKSTLQVNKNIYAAFMDEFEIYRDLNDEEAAENWRKTHAK